MSALKKINIAALAKTYVLKNPIVGREFLTHSRQRLNFVASALGLGLVSFIVFCIHSANTRPWGLSGRSEMPFVLFGGAIFVQCFFPMFSSGAIAAEREKDTFDLLRTTSLTPGQIVMGKFTATLHRYFMLLLLMTPVMMSPILGGYAPLDIMVLGWFTVLLHGVMNVALGIAISSVYDRARNASLMSFVASSTLTAPLFGLPIIFYFARSADTGNGSIFYASAVVMLFGAMAWTVFLLANARSALAPTGSDVATSRFKWVKAALTLCCVGAGAAALAIDSDLLRNADQEVIIHCLTWTLGVSALLMGIFEVSLRSRAQRHFAEQSAGRTALKLGLWFSLSAALGVLVGFVGAARSLGVGPAFSFLGMGLLSFSLFYLFMMQTTALMTRVLRKPFARAFLASLCMSAIIIGPLFFHNLWRNFSAGKLFLTLYVFNPLIVAGSVPDWNTSLRFFDIKPSRVVPELAPFIFVAFYVIINVALFVINRERKARAE